MDSRFRGNDGWGRVVQGLPLGGEAGGGALRAPARLPARALSQSPPQGERPEGRAPTRGAPTGGMDSRFRGNDGWGRGRALRRPEWCASMSLGGCEGAPHLNLLPGGEEAGRRAPSLKSPPQGEWPEGGMDSRFRGNDGVLRGHHRVSGRHGITPLSERGQGADRAMAFYARRALCGFGGGV